MKKLVLSTMVLMLGVAAANAFVYGNDRSLEWTDGNGTGLWNEDGNWDNVQGPDHGIPVDGDDYACIDSGTANITSSSRPTGEVYRVYVGGTSGATLNIGADAASQRLLVGWTTSETGTVNLTSGTLTLSSATNVRLGHIGTGILNMSGGTLNGIDLIMAFDNTNPGGNRLEVSGGDFNLSSFLQMRQSASTVSVQGSSATIDMAGFTVYAGKGHSLELGLDAGGVSPINTTSNATLQDLAILVDDLAGFNGQEGDTYDIFSSATFITTNGLTLTSNIDGVDFGASIVTEGGKEILRLTILAPFKFQMAGTKVVSSGFQLQWNSVAGQTYRLDVSTNLTDSPSFAVLQSGIPGASGTTEFIDTNTTDKVQAYYRVHVE